MKKILALLLVIIPVALSAQKAAVQTAYNYLRYDNLDKAKEAIDGAVVNETTIGFAKAWYYRGSIYQKIFESSNEKFAALKPGSLQTARISYEKTLELDSKNEFREDVIGRLEILASQSLNSGVDHFQMVGMRKRWKHSKALLISTRNISIVWIHFHCTMRHWLLTKWVIRACPSVFSKN